jgi:3-(methylthio)propanoyl-CoA dehydrogenase
VFTSGAIKEFEEVKLKPEFEFLKRILITMTSEYEKTITFINETGDAEFLDFHSRRLVEMAGNIIMGYLLLLDANKNEDFRNSAEIFIKKGISENRQKQEYIRATELKDLGMMKY